MLRRVFWALGVVTGVTVLVTAVSVGIDVKSFTRQNGELAWGNVVLLFAAAFSAVTMALRALLGMGADLRADAQRHDGASASAAPTPAEPAPAEPEAEPSAPPSEPIRGRYSGEQPVPPEMRELSTAALEEALAGEREKLAYQNVLIKQYRRESDVPVRLRRDQRLISQRIRWLEAELQRRGGAAA